MKITKVINKIIIDAKVKSILDKETTYIIGKTERTNKYKLKNGFIMGIDGKIQGIDRIIDIYKIIPYKRYIFKHKR